MSSSNQNLYLIVTFSELSSSELRGELITVDDRQQRPLAIPVRDEHYYQYQVVVEPDCSYVVSIYLLTRKE